MWCRDSFDSHEWLHLHPGWPYYPRRIYCSLAHFSQNRSVTSGPKCIGLLAMNATQRIHNPIEHYLLENVSYPPPPPSCPVSLSPVLTTMLRICPHRVLSLLSSAKACTSPSVMTSLPIQTTLCLNTLAVPTPRTGIPNTFSKTYIHPGYVPPVRDKSSKDRCWPKVLEFPRTTKYDPVGVGYN